MAHGASCEGRKKDGQERKWSIETQAFQIAEESGGGGVAEWGAVGHLETHAPHLKRHA